MKKNKKFACVFIFTMVMSIFGAITVIADDEEGITYVAEANAPIIDGNIDEVWETAEALYTSKLGDGMIYEEKGSYGKVLWNEKGFYFLAEVMDKTINNLDRINIWVSEVYTSENIPYSSVPDDGNYSFCITPMCENMVYTPLDVSQYWTAKTNRSDTGYIIEVYMPVIGTSDLVEGNYMGLDISLDRYNTSTERDYYEYWNGGGKYWSNVGALKKMKLFKADINNLEKTTINPDTNKWKSSDWATAEIEKAQDMNLIPKCFIDEDLTKGITRAEFAHIAVIAYEAFANTNAMPLICNPFVDTSDIEVLKAYNVGIVTGTSATTFEPDNLLNREQAATMLTRAYKSATLDYMIDYDKSITFADDEQISDWAKVSVYFMSANGIINGIGENKFAPNNSTTNEQASGYANLTREQAIIMIVRMIENL